MIITILKIIILNKRINDLKENVLPNNKKMKVIKMANEFDDVLSAIDEILEDATVPRNVKNKMEEIKQIILKSDVETSIKINQALNILDDLSEESNINSFTRTQIWNVASLLESI